VPVASVQDTLIDVPESTLTVSMPVNAALVVVVLVLDELVELAAAAVVDSSVPASLGSAGTQLARPLAAAAMRSIRTAI
jgi:hypothetical protein